MRGFLFLVMRSFTKRTAYIFVFTAFLSLSLYAQAPAPTATPPASEPLGEENQVIKVDSRLIVVPVSVTTQTGDPVTGLTAKDFRVVEEGRPQQIDSVGNAESVPLEIALLFDVSASTDAMFKFQQETAAKFLQQVMKPTDRATIFTVGARPIMVHGRDTVENSAVAIKAIQPTKSYTAFYDTVAAAADHLRKNAPEGTRRVILTISDGEDTNSARVAKAIQEGYAKVDVNKLDRKSLYDLTVKNSDAASQRERTRIVKALQDADTVFYSINPAGSSYQLNKLSIVGQENMQRFASETGGSAYLPKFLPIDLKEEVLNASNMRKNTAMLESIFNQLANELRAQYLVRYYSDAEYPENRYVKLSLGLQTPGTNRIRAREGYYVKH